MPGNSKAQIEFGRNTNHSRKGFGLGCLLVGIFGFVVCFFFLLLLLFVCFLFVFVFVWGCFGRATQLVGS